MKNRLTVFSKPWPELSLEALGKLVKGLGFAGVELPVRPGYQVTPENVTQGLPEAAKILADQGVAIGSLAGPADERTIEACAAAGCPIIRVCVDIQRKLGSYFENEARVRAGYDVLAPALKQHGVSIGVQNHCDRCVGSAIGIMHLIEQYDPAVVSAVLDPGHCAVDGEPPDMAIDITWSHLSLINMKSASHRRTNGLNEVEPTWEVYWTSAQHAGYSWRATLEELRKRDYRKDLCLVAEYTDPPGGQYMGNAVLPNLRYDMAYISYLMSEKSASEPFVYEEWSR